MERIYFPFFGRGVTGRSAFTTFPKFVALPAGDFFGPTMFVICDLTGWIGFIGAPFVTNAGISLGFLSALIFVWPY